MSRDSETSSSEPQSRVGAWLRSLASDRRRLIAVIGLTLIGLVSVGVGAAMAAWNRACAGGCPTAEQIVDFAPQQATVLYDAEGDVLAMFYRERRQLISVSDLPRHVTMAFVSIEDRRFYDHEGVDLWRLLGAVRDNVFSGFGASGASTISMQLARNLFPQQLPRGEKSLRRKIAEARLALTMERRFSKDEILELYLNHIYLGAGAYGIEAAARTYFDKGAAELNLAEAATLAALPQAPSAYNPRRNPSAAQGRRGIVLDWMVATGSATAEEAAAAKASPLGLAPPSGVVRASYFVEHIRRELEDQLGELLYTGGLRIYTTVDPVLQAEAEAALEDHLQQVERGTYGYFRHPTYADFVKERAENPSSPIGNTPYLQGVVVVMEPHSGNVLAMVGGRDFQHSQFNRATQARRQPGSAFKPYVYGAAIEAGRSPLYQISDRPIFISQPDGSTWAPRNYSGEYAGDISLREALRQSKNMAAIRLGQEVGIEGVRSMASRAGLDTEIPNYPSVYIGAAGVFPIDLIASYAAFSNGGMKVEPRFVRRIEDRAGRLLWEPKQPPLPTIDPAVSWILTDMLREVVDRGTGYTVRNPAVGNLPYEIPAAGKTGTTNGNTDVWFVGYTPDLVAGVWLGMDQPRTISSGATGGGFAVPVWARVMRKYYEDRDAPTPWERPDNVVTRNVSSWTGKPVSEDCPYLVASHSDLFVRGRVPEPGCDSPGEWTDPQPHLPGEAVRPEEPRYPRPQDFVDTLNIPSRQP